MTIPIYASFNLEICADFVVLLVDLALLAFLLALLSVIIMTDSNPLIYLNKKNLGGNFSKFNSLKSNYNRLVLNSVNATETMHEFQIVHAIITQCRKHDGQFESSRNNMDSENRPVSENHRSTVRRKNSSSFVSTISRTINALTQATNPSHCAKQSSHPVSIAVKNIISQFGNRQACHGNLSLPSSTDTSATKNSTNQKGPATRKRSPHNKTRRPIKSVSPPQPIKSTTPSLPSTSKKEVLESKPVKNIPKDSVSNSNPVATKPKLRSVRQSNALKLSRHESAPIPLNNFDQSVRKKTITVRRSQSDAVCYNSYIRQTRRKIESNVQTKVLHFENCCKGKGQASMCLECRKHNIEQGTATPTRVSPSTPKIDTAKSKLEKFVDSLSHQKSTTAQSTNTETDASQNSCLPPITPQKTLVLTAAKAKAVACPGGTFFGSSAKSKTVENQIETDIACSLQNSIPKDETNTNISSEKQCSQSKRKHSFSDDESMQTKRESRDDGEGNAVAALSCSSSNNFETELSETPSQSVNHIPNNEVIDMELIPPSNIPDNTISIDVNGNMYSALCNCDQTINARVNRASTLPNMDINISAYSSESFNIEIDQNMSENYDSSDNMDSSSSSNESCVSPRQDYLSRKSGNTPRRTPSTRYQKMRRKLKKLICRSKSCPETSKPIIAQSQSELEIQYLESIRIPTPSFMRNSDSFSSIRQQLAMHFDGNLDYTKRLPDDVLSKIFSYLDTKTLSNLKCVCKDYQFLIESYDIRATDSLWVKDKRYLEDPCKFCRKKFVSGDVSMCRYHAKSYHCDLPYGRSYWMCCFQVERSAPGCRTGIHNNYWGTQPHPVE